MNGCLWRCSWGLLCLLSLHISAQPLPDSTLQALDSLGTDAARGAWLRQTGIQYHTHNPELALRYLKASIPYSGQSADSAQLGETYVTLGRTLYELGRYREALDYTLQAYQRYKTLGMEKGLSDALNELGSLYDILGQSEKALASLQQSLRLRQAMGDSIRIAESYNNLGVYYYYQSQLDSALAYYQLALAAIPDSLTEEEKAVLQGAYLNNVGEIYLLRGQYEEAQAYLNASIAASRQHGNLRMVSMTLMNIAQLYGENGRTARALELLTESETLADSIENRLLLRDIYQRQIEFYKATDNLPAALDTYEQLLAVKDSIFNRDHLEDIARMNTQYETAQQAQRIAVLEARRERDRLLRNSLVVIALLAFGLTLSIRYTVRKVRGVNSVLAEKNQAIREQHDQIQQQAEETQQLNEALQLRNLKMTDQQAVLEEKQRNITSSIRYASQIQQVMLPPVAQLRTYFSDAFVLNRPRDIVSGDFYWFDEVNGYRVVALADCTGHGVPGGFMTMLGHSILTELINDRHLTEPGAVLEVLDQKITEAISTHPSPDGLSIQDGMDMVLLAFHPETYTLQYAGAKVTWFLQRGAELHEFRGSRYPIGSAHWAKEKVFETFSIQVEPGDRIILLSDGYQDQFGGPSPHSKYLKKRLRALLNDSHTAPLPELGKHLDVEFEAWKGSQPQTDDVLVVGLEV